MNEDRVRPVRRSRGTGHARIEDVARHAQVSAQTVSRFFRDPRQVSSGVAERIRMSVEAIGYVPNLVAGALASNRSFIVAILVPTIANPIHAAPVQALSDILRPAGYQVLVGTTDYDPTREQDLVAAFIGRRVDGIVLTGTSFTDYTARILARACIPVVQLWELPRHPIDMAVGVDNDAAGIAVARHFFERGYRRFAVLGHDAAGDTRSAARLDGFDRETRRLGLAPPHHFSYSRPTDMTQAAEMLARLKAPGREADAVFCVGAPIAIGLVLTAPKLGIAIPGELAVAAFGDNDLAPLLSPALTTVGIPRYELGRKAGEMLLRRFAGQQVEAPVVDIGFTLLARETT